VQPLTYYKLRVFPYFVRNEEFCNYLRKKGILLGKKAKFFEPGNVFIDVSRPELLKIGAYCKISRGVTILTHDYSRSVLRRVYGEVIGDGAAVEIGENVFIGMNAIILMGAHIGNNVIVGAGSVVNGYVPDNVVVAGNPARVVKTLDEFYHQRKEKSLIEAKNFFLEKEKRAGRIPLISEMDPWFPLFLERDIRQLKKNHIFTNLSGDEEEEVISFFLQSAPVFKNYEEFIEWCHSE